MYTIRSVSAEQAAALSLQLGLENCHPETGQHLLDCVASYRGAFAGEELVGLVRLSPISPEGLPDSDFQRLDGPFFLPAHAACVPLLQAEVVAQLPTWASLWRPARPAQPTPSGEYSADDIKVFLGPEAIRRRPGMYVGSLGDFGLREMIFEPISNTLDEHVAGHAHHLTIDYDEAADAWTIADDGRGIPPGPLDRHGMTPLERAMAVLFYGPYRGSPRLHVHAGTHGLGLVVLAALTTRCEVVSAHAGGRFRQVFSRGLRQSFAEPLPPTGKTGLWMRFVPDREVFREASPGAVDIRERLFTLACFNPRLQIRLHGEVLQAAGGLRTLAETRAGTVLEDVLEIDAQAEEGVRVRAVLGWRPGRRGEDVLWSYANQSETEEGGSHAQGARLALRGKPKAGRVVLLSVEVADPRFGGRTRGRLEMPEVKPIVTRVLQQALERR